MQHFINALTLLAAAVTSAGLAPQDEAGAQDALPNFDLVAPSGIVYFDVDDDGAHWIMGDSYKAKVTGFGFTYIPFLGSDAPQNYPVEMRLASASASGGALALSSAGAVSRTESRFVIDRGPVQVIYDVAADGVEQSFQFAAGMSGALELEVDVTSELSGESGVRGFQWRNELGGVNYGAAVAFDQAGHEGAVSSSLSQGASNRRSATKIRHRVSADFVNSASGAVLVDPQISTFVLMDSPKAQQHPDVAYDVERDRYMVVVEESFSYEDHDLRKIHVRAYSGSTTGSGYLDLTTANVRNPSVAHVVSPNRFMVAANESFAGSDSSRVMGRRVSGSGETIGNWTTLVDTAGDRWDGWLPKLGGDNRSFGTNEFGLVTRIQSGAFADMMFHRISPVTGRQVPNSERRLARRPMDRLRRVAISRTTGDSQGDREWAIAMFETYSDPNYQRVETMTIRHDGTIAHPLHVAYFGPCGHNISPSRLSVSSLGAKRDPGTGEPYYLIAFLTNREGIVFSTSREGTAVLCSGRRRHDLRKFRDFLHEGDAEYDAHIATATTRNGWVVAHGHGQGHASIWMTNLSAVNGKLAAIDRRVDLGGYPAHRVAIATTYEGGSGAYSDALILSDDWGDQPIRVKASIVLDLTEEAVGVQYCYGSPNSTLKYGFIGAGGNTSPTSPKRLHASGLPLSEWGYFMSSRSQAYDPAAWGGSGVLCLWQPRAIWASLQQVSDAGTIEFSMDPTALPAASGTTSAVAGQTWYFQAWHGDNGVSNFTNAVAIPFQ